MQKQVSHVEPLLKPLRSSIASRVRPQGKVLSVSGQFVMDFAAEADGMQPRVHAD